MPRQETNPKYPNPNPNPSPNPNPNPNPNPSQAGGAEDELIELELTLLRRCTQRVRRSLPLLLLHVAPYLQPCLQPCLQPALQLTLQPGGGSIGSDPAPPSATEVTGEMEEMEGAAALLRAYMATLVARLCPPLRR